MMDKVILHKGIDVSVYQGNIDWSKVKNNIDFAIIRCGYGGDYTSQDDKQWKNNIAACEKHGIPYGVYLYSYATTSEKAKSEAEHVIRLLKDYKPDMPVFLDLEEDRIAKLGNPKILEIAKTFCNEIEKAGFVYGTYANKNWFVNYLTDKWYDDHSKWLAQYNSEVTYKGKYDIWQYSDSGNVPGILGHVDMNFCYISIVKGDMNGDGKVTAADARKILRISAGIESVSGQESINADIDGDGKITAADARKALRISTGLEE